MGNIRLISPPQKLQTDIEKLRDKCFAAREQDSYGSVLPDPMERRYRLKHVERARNLATVRVGWVPSCAFLLRGVRRDSQ